MNRLVVSIALMFGLAATSMAEQIGKITKFKGKAVIVNLETATTITKVGQPINKGDTIQTENGEVDVAFTDGAILKVRPYSTTCVEERTEKKGFFKNKKENVRRVTCFVGKMYFKSGTSDKKNYIQSPTAVCALRGTEVEFGVAGSEQAYLKLISGAADTAGKVLRTAFPDIGKSEAARNLVYQSINKASADIEAAGTGNRAKSITARRELHRALNIAQGELQSCPNSQVRKFAKATTALMTTLIVQANAELQVMQAKAQELAAQTDAEKKAASDALAAANAAKDAADAAAEQAIKGIADDNLGQVMQAGNEALNLAQNQVVGVVTDTGTQLEVIQTIEVQVYEAQ